jgi:type III restriction enzyme
VFNRIVGDSHFELQFADFLESCEDIISYAKNYFSVHFKIDYKDANGNISNYYPDFFVKASNKEIYIVETKGREDLDDVEKIKRLYQWCDDINAIQNKIKFTALYIKQDDFEKYTPKKFNDLVNNFKK